jgi:hypothetical protein
MQLLLVVVIVGLLTMPMNLASPLPAVINNEERAAVDVEMCAAFIDEDTLELFENVCVVCAHIYKETDSQMNSKCR